MLRLGATRDVLVCVQPDSPDSVATLRALFADWLDDTMVDELAELAPAFEVHLTSAATTRGRHTLPHLRYGREVLIRADEATPVLHALAMLLGGIHDHHSDDGQARVDLRAFNHADRVVLTDIARPHLVNDRELYAAGVNEIVHWGLVLDGDALLVPEPLEAKWRDAGIPNPHQFERLQICGLVVHDRSGFTLGTQLARLTAHSSSQRWFTIATRLTESGLVRATRDRANARSAVLRFLLKAEPTAPENSHH